MDEKLLVDYTKRKRVLKAKGIVRCPKCNEMALREEGKKGTHYTHKKYQGLFGLVRLEGCYVKND